MEQELSWRATGRMRVMGQTGGRQDGAAGARRMRVTTTPERPQSRQRVPKKASRDEIKGRNQDTKPPLEHPRLAHSRHLPHQNREVEAGGVYQKALRDVVVPPKMHPAHPARLVAVRERPLHQLRPAARQSRSPRPPDAPTIPIHRSLHLPSPPPAPPATLRLRYMTPKTRSGQTRHRPATTSRFPPAPPNGPAPPPPLRESPLASPCPPGPPAAPSPPPVPRSACSALCAIRVQPSFIFATRASRS